MQEVEDGKLRAMRAPQRSPLSWDEVRLFLALMRTRRLSLAGKTLGFDTSTASRRLARLEAQLDVALFDRTREGLEPTPAAQRLLSAAEAMERASLQFSRELDGLEREVEGLVRLSAPPGVADSFVVPLLPRLLQRHPRLSFELDVSVQQADLSRRETDLALRVIRPTGGPLVMQKLTTTPWVPLARPELVAALGVVSSWDQVRFITWARPLDTLHVARWLSTRMRREAALRTNSFPAQVTAVQQGLGVALMPEPYAAVHGLLPLRLSRALRRDARSLPSDALWLVTHQSLRHVPRVAATWEFLSGAFGR